ncbi:SDR family oxidoreductase [Polynucleobacter sp. MWH-Mekk-B1]|uniref:UDP-glucose 4-epimerase family protein n=1 Tax=Polynucleobacter finlandensis TaxID=1855894 RepID=UPI001C0DBC68|nr:SDR family oxidoreductase [Polynucleobacter finlandensis]MBU3543971.1 SDR family oxidoreductase [Polynucleobacter finlandensis]
MRSHRILLTGATGFVGANLLERLITENYAVLATVRHLATNPLIHQNLDYICMGELTSSLNWSKALDGIDTVIHLAARAHVMSEHKLDPLSEYRRINVDCTLNLARQAAKLGVKRFIYLSSIKVNGEVTDLNTPFTPKDIPQPQDSYGISKYEAEIGLLVLANNSDLELVIIRPPLIYGAGVKGNILTMMRWLSRQIILPLGAIRNRRSLVSVDNLVDLIVCCIDHPSAVNQVFLVSDEEDLSTPELLHRMGKALNKPTYLISIPVGLLKFCALLLGKRHLMERLCSSLWVDISKTQNLLGWSPISSVDEGLRKCADDFIR